MTVLLDTHVLIWLATDSDELSPAALRAIRGADELAVAAISWFEAAWLAAHGRVAAGRPLRSWLLELSGRVRTVGATPEVASSAVELPDSFPRDPMDRLICATAIEHGWPLVTKDARIRNHPATQHVTIW